VDHYLDFRLLPDPEFPSTQLMNALFSKLHRCLVRLGNGDIAVSFPESQSRPASLGPVLRLHSSSVGFERLQSQAWLNGMRDHVRIGEVKEVPPVVEYRRVRRVQSKSNPDRIRRRQMKRHGWTEEEALEKIPDSSARRLALPFLQLDSRSSGRRFLLFLEHAAALEMVPGTFNAYGLSVSGTVPWF